MDRILGNRVWKPLGKTTLRGFVSILSTRKNLKIVVKQAEVPV